MTETDSNAPGANGACRTTPGRQIHCQDALPWLRANSPLSGCSVITSLPDLSGLPEMDLASWREWFIDAAALCLNATPDDGVTIFYQTDIRHRGGWVDKGFLCQLAAERAAATLLWHKIVCRKPAGVPRFGRPGFAHLLCFSRSVLDCSLPAYADVLPDPGAMTWSQAMPMRACELACHYVLSHTPSRTIVDPFCGHGSVLAVANGMGLDAVGVELGKKRARKARALSVSRALRTR